MSGVRVCEEMNSMVVYWLPLTSEGISARVDPVILAGLLPNETNFGHVQVNCCFLLMHAKDAGFERVEIFLTPCLIFAFAHE